MITVAEVSAAGVALNQAIELAIAKGREASELFADCHARQVAFAGLANASGHSMAAAGANLRQAEGHCDDAVIMGMSAIEKNESYVRGL